MRNFRIQDRYIKATKKGKTKILDEFTATTIYNRNYAARILVSDTFLNEATYKLSSTFLDEATGQRRL